MGLFLLAAAQAAPAGASAEEATLQPQYANGGSSFIEFNANLPSKMLQLTPTPVLDDKANQDLFKHGLATRRPRARLVVPDVENRVPVLFPANGDGDNTHWRPHHQDFWLRVFNPSVGFPSTDEKDERMVVKVATWSYCRVGSREPVRHDGSNESYSMDSDNEAYPPEFLVARNNPYNLFGHYPTYSAYMRGGKVKRMYKDVADTRIFSMEGRPYGIFSRIVDTSTMYVQPYILDFEATESAYEDELDQMQLRWDEAADGHQRNWSPLPVPASAPGRMYVTYSICPHIVLDCEMSTGHCQRAYETLTPSVCENDDGKVALRGGSLPVDLSTVPGLSNLIGGDFLLSVAHTVEDVEGHNSVFRKYVHRFILYDSVPPFAVRASSVGFSFPDFFGTKDAPSELDSIQYCTGATLRGTNLTLSYGVGDCIAMKVQLPLAYVFSTIVKMYQGQERHALIKSWEGH